MTPTATASTMPVRPCSIPRPRFGYGNICPAGGIAVGPGATRNLLVAADILSTAVVSGTIRTSIADQSYVVVASPDLKNAFATLTGRLVTITDLADTVYRLTSFGNERYIQAQYGR